MDIFEKEDYLKNIFEASLKYINNDLKKYYGKEIKVQIKIISDELNKINGWADKIDGIYIVGIYWGCYHWIDDFWKKMVTNPDFLTVVSGEGVDCHEKELADSYYSLMLLLSLKCLIFHELGHIFNGHIDYIKEKNGHDVKLYKFADKDHIESESLGNINPIVWQSIEWNADDFAATRMIGQSTYSDIIEKSIIKNKEHGLWLTIISQVVVYSLMYMGAEDRVQSDYTKNKHLPLRFRLESIIKSMVQVYESFNGKISGKIPFNMYMEAAFRIEEWVTLFMENEYKPKINISVENNKDDLDENHREYYNKVEKYYLSNLEDELKSYTYMKVLYK